MTSSQDLDKSKDFDEKDDTSSRSGPRDEEHALQSGKADDVERPASKDRIEPEQPSQAKDTDPPPNGGLTAWLQVVGSFMLFFNTFGILK